MPKVLVANRGEIAIRVLRAATELGWSTVAVYTKSDESHATFSDEAVELHDVSQYLNVQRMVEIAMSTKCTHLHPGYGFLSESSSLAAALPKSVTFIGPSVETLRITSDKVLSRTLAISLGINVAPGERALSDEDVRAFARAHGYPIMIKALDGGGGRGIRVVEADETINQAFKRCLGESPSHQVFVEKALIGPSWKHVEVQIMGDNNGSVNHLWERECSVQRRFQKIIEMAPSRLPEDIIETLLKSSLKLAHHLKYHGLGTFEYLVNSQSGEWVFLEINPRIQVEHTVTEEITGIDLVQTQLLLFTPSMTLKTLPLAVPPRPHLGYAIQLRLTAEDSSSFRLSPGMIRSSDIIWPSGLGIRIDTWLTNGPFSGNAPSEWTIGTDFDSLLAKLVIRGSDFDSMTRRARRAMRELKFRGQVKTNLDLLLGALEHPDWNSGTIDTTWLERNVNDILRLGKSVMETPHTGKGMEKALQQVHESHNTSSTHGSTILQPGALFHLTLSPVGSSTEHLPDTTKHTLTLNSIAHNGFPDRLSGTLQTTLSATPFTFSLSQSSSAAIASSMFELADPNNPTHIASPFTGKITELHPVLSTVEERAQENQYIEKGETIVVMSVMKMETAITCPSRSKVKRLGKGIQTGAVVGEGILVCVLSNNTDTITSRL